MEVWLPFGLGQLRELEAAFKELVCRRRGKLERSRVPAFELGQAASRSDFRLEQAKVALGKDDAGLHILERCAFGSDPERNEIAAERRSGAAGDHEQRAEASSAH
jgi:hypothetical protein